MKKTKKQYEVFVKYKYVDYWCNAMNYEVNGYKTYADSLEEAKQVIENTKKMWEDDKKRNGRIVREGQVSVFIESVKDDAFDIVQSRIREREVTEWKEVEIK